MQTETPPPGGAVEEEDWAWPGAWQGAWPSAKEAVGPVAGLATWAEPELGWGGGKVGSKELWDLKEEGGEKE